MSQVRKVAKNTLFLYIKMGLGMVIGLYSTRLILAALGVVDFGIFNVVGGVIGMLTFLNASMTVSSQRYFSVNLGSGDMEKSQEIYKVSTYLHLLIGFIVVLILEILGLFIFDGFLNIPEERIETAKTVYQLMILSTFFTMNAVPFDAVINAHENMLFDAIVGIVETILKLAIALAITYYGTDKLLFYVILFAGLTIFIRLIKSIYCIRKYPEVKLDFKQPYNKPLFREMLGFASWNLMGSLAGMGRNQGIALVLNIFFGAVVNAAYGIANQVSNQLSSFSSMMLKAVNPQIMKSEGANDRTRMLRLSMITCKVSFFLLALFAVPFIFEMEEILMVWLKKVPEYSVIFCQLVLIAQLTNLLTIGLASALQATGKIKAYQTVVGLLLLSNIPVAYLLLKMGFSAYFAIISYIIIELIACVFRILFLKKLGGLSIKEYLNRVIAHLILPLLLSVFCCYIITANITFPFRFVFTMGINGIVFLIAIYYFGLYKEEKDLANSTLVFVKNKIRSRG